MEDFFIIPHKRIEEGWHPADNSFELFILEYCEEVLDIPLFLIEDASNTDEGIEIQLKHIEGWMMGEDWYINLSRLSHYAKAS